MTNGNFDSQKIGEDVKWWTGIIVDDQSWKGNLLAEKWSSIDQLPGWGARYRVRIVGKHPQDKNKLPDDKLELCEVMYPVTAGTGHGASYQTSNLRKGSVVFGIYKDSEGNEPLIIGCIGNNSQTYLNAKQKNGFDTLRGLSTTPLYAVPSDPSGVPKSSDGKSSPTIESAVADKQRNIEDERQSEDQRVKTNIPTTSTCEPIQLTGVALTIKNLIQDIEKAKKEINDWKYKLTNELISENGQKFGLDEYIRYKVQNASQEIVGWFKNLIFEIKRRVNGNIERGAKDLYYLLFPNARPKAKAAIETAGDLINCLFRKIIGQLISMLTKFLLDAVDRFINVPLCAAENILAGLIGKLTGLISSALDAIMAPVNALLGAVDLVGDVLEIVKDILTFLSCDDPPNCSEIKEWSIYDGPDRGLNIDLNSFFDKVKTFASNVQQSVNPNNFDFDLDFSDVFNNPCNVGAVFCGPPKVEFFGGGGSGAAGNAIVSGAGEILGVDITLPGSNYTSAPFVRFVDSCGKGKGAVGRVVLTPIRLGEPTLPSLPTLPTLPSQSSTPTPTPTPEPTPVPEPTPTSEIDQCIEGPQETRSQKENKKIPQNYGVDGVVMLQSGSGYIPVSNGDRGGDGRVWARNDQTTIKRKNGTYDKPYDCGEEIQVFCGDEIVLPAGLCVQLGTKIICGPKPIISHTKALITAPCYPSDSGTGPGIGTITTPGGPGVGTSTPGITQEVTIVDGNVPRLSNYVRSVEYPTLDGGNYPVILYLCGIEIENSGFNYTETDRIIIEPSNGATAVPKFGSFGTLEGVKITSGGEGFKELPNIYIESETGFNAKLIPRFCIDRVSADQLKEPGIQDKIISVVDCVGKVPQVDFFRVPQ